jgi:hypothetical protein
MERFGSMSVFGKLPYDVSTLSVIQQHSTVGFAFTF